MKRALLGSAISLAMLAGASAADLPVYTKAPPPPPAWNWTGTYVGIEGGGGWGRTNQSDLNGVTTNPYNQNGGIFGGTSGLQIQYGSWVLGAESDISWANINGSVATAGCNGGTCFTNLQWLGTSRSRIGYAWDRWMIFAAGGLAYGNIKAGQGSCPTIPGNFGFCGTNTELGWTAGGGIEAFIAPGWSAKLEYLYVDLGNHYSYTPVVPIFATERVSVLRAGLNYHFNWGSLMGGRY
jgi:outer membrane immunogenic protein